MNTILRGLIVLLATLTFATPAIAQDDAPKNAQENAAEEPKEDPLDPAFKRHVLRYQTLTLFAVNPLALANITQVGYRYMLFDSDSALLKDTYAALMLNPINTPAFSRLGLRAELKPLAVLKLTARYEFIKWFGTFDQLMPFDSPRQDASNEAREARGDNGENLDTTATALTFEALLQAKVGSIAVRSNIRSVTYDVDLRGGNQKAFYDATTDTLAPTQGTILNVDTDLLYVSGGPLTAGLRHTYVNSFFDDSDFAEGEPTTNPNTPIHRLGILMAYKLNNTKGTLYNEPTIILISQWHLKHRYRAGQEFPQAAPFTVIGFSFNGDLN